MTAEKPLLICLMGPTASGKTDLAIALAGQLDCELVSVDSALVYRGMDIGSAKPEYPHHLVDIRDPAQPYSAADFVEDAHRVCAQIVARGKTPLLVGGSMLYFKAFLEGLDDMPAADPAARAQIAAEAAAHGWPHIHRQLAEVDPESAARIHPHHSQRLSRALEVYRVSGQTLTELHGGVPFDSGALRKAAVFDLYRVVQMAICPLDRVVLHDRIATRFQLMMAAGFLAEVQALWQRADLQPELPAVRAVGYRQLWRHLDGDCTLEEAVNDGIAATRQLAKRQLTWLRKWPHLGWIYTDCDGNVVKMTDVGEGRYGAGEERSESPLEAALNYLDSAPL